MAKKAKKTKKAKQKSKPSRHAALITATRHSSVLAWFLEDYYREEPPEWFPESTLELREQDGVTSEEMTEEKRDLLCSLCANEILTNSSFTRFIVKLYDSYPKQFKRFLPQTASAVTNNRPIWDKLYAVLLEGLEPDSVSLQPIGDRYIEKLSSYLDERSNTRKHLPDGIGKKRAFPQADEEICQNFFALNEFTTIYMHVSAFDMGWTKLIEEVQYFRFFCAEDKQARTENLSRVFHENDLARIFRLTKECLNESRQHNWAKEGGTPMPLEYGMLDRVLKVMPMDEKEYLAAFPDGEDENASEAGEKDLRPPKAYLRDWHGFFQLCIDRGMMLHIIYLSSMGINGVSMLADYPLSDRELRNIVSTAYVLTRNTSDYTNSHRAYTALLANRITDLCFQRIWMKAYKMKEIPISVKEEDGEETAQEEGNIFADRLHEAEEKLRKAEETSREHEKREDEMKKDLAKKNRDIKDLTAKVRLLEAELKGREEEELTDEIILQEDDDTFVVPSGLCESEKEAYFSEIIAKKTVGVYGPREALKNKMGKRWPRLIWIDRGANFTPSVAKTMDMVILRTDYISHGEYYKVKAQIKNSGLPFRQTLKEQNNEMYIIDAVIDMYEQMAEADNVDSQ